MAAVPEGSERGMANAVAPRFRGLGASGVDCRRRCGTTRRGGECCCGPAMTAAGELNCPQKKKRIRLERDGAGCLRSAPLYIDGDGSRACRGGLTAGAIPKSSGRLCRRRRRCEPARTGDCGEAVWLEYASRLRCWSERLHLSPSAAVDCFAVSLLRCRCLPAGCFFGHQRGAGRMDNAEPFPNRRRRSGRASAGGDRALIQGSRRRGFTGSPEVARCSGRRRTWPRGGVAVEGRGKEITSRWWRGRLRASK